ncbi:MAG: hypothetical protein QM704_09650 [Anaeromyxobacteraceae bacterium]
MERQRRLLVEYALVTAFLVIAAAGAVAIFGDELRAALGLGQPAPAAQASPAPPAR